MAAVVLAVAVGIGQVTGGQRACAAAFSGSALTGYALSGAAASGSQVATHYVLQGLPNCSYPSLPANQFYVALSPGEYNSAAACGGYLEVHGPDGSVTVQVIDQCPECATGHIDLSEPAFAKIAPLSAGLINVSYSYLLNPTLPGPITAEVKQGSSRFWLALLFDNTGNPLASVQVKSTSGSWLSMSRASYNYWIAGSGAGNGPFTVRLTDTQGHQATLSGITLAPGSVQRTGAFMYGAGRTGTVAPTSPAPASPAATAAATDTASGTASPPPTTPTPSGLATASGTPGARRTAAGGAPTAGQNAKPAAVSRPSPPLSPRPSVSSAAPTC